MRLTDASWGVPVDIQEDFVSQLIIENPNLLRKTAATMKLQAEGNDGSCQLFENGDMLNFGKIADFVSDCFSFQVNNRKVINGLYQQLQQNAKDAAFYTETNILESKIFEYFTNLEMSVDFPLDWEMDLDWIGMFKLLQVKIRQDGTDMRENLLYYMEAMRHFCGIRLFIFLRLKSFFTPEEMQEFYDDILYRKLSVLLLEDRESYRLEKEKTWIIDKDLCAIF